MPEKLRRALPLVSFALFLILPLCVAAGDLFRRDYELLRAPEYASLLTAFSLASLLFRDREPDYLRRVVYALLSPSALVCGIAMLPRTESRSALVLMTAAAIGAFVLLFLDPVTNKAKIPLAIVCTVGMSALLLLNFTGILLYGESLDRTEVYPSPDYALAAEVRTVDQGVMGGSIELSVRENKPPMTLFFGRYVPRAAELYFANDSALPQSAAVEWTDESHLLFLGESYDLAGMIP